MISSKLLEAMALVAVLVAALTLMSHALGVMAAIVLILIRQWIVLMRLSGSLSNLEQAVIHGNKVALSSLAVPQDSKEELQAVLRVDFQGEAVADILADIHSSLQA